MINDTHRHLFTHTHTRTHARTHTRTHTHTDNINTVHNGGHSIHNVQTDHTLYTQ